MQHRIEQWEKITYKITFERFLLLFWKTSKITEEGSDGLFSYVPIILLETVT